MNPPNQLLGGGDGVKPSPKTTRADNQKDNDEYYRLPLLFANITCYRSTKKVLITKCETEKITRGPAKLAAKRYVEDIDRVAGRIDEPFLQRKK